MKQNFAAAALSQFGNLARRYCRDTVSNVHTIKADGISEKNCTFAAKAYGGKSGLQFSDFFVRSNYANENVVLLLEASALYPKNDGQLEENPLGYVTIPLIDRTGQRILQNKTYTLNLVPESISNRCYRVNTSATSEAKLFFKVREFQKSDIGTADSLPDVLIWNPLYVRIASYYRLLLGETLVKSRINQLSAELIPDPFLSLFPVVADQPDLINLVRSLWIIKAKMFSSKITEAEEAREFREHFMKTAFVVQKTLAIPDYDIKSPADQMKRQAALKSFLEQYSVNQKPMKFLSMQKCKPINVFDYTVDLVGLHALD